MNSITLRRMIDMTLNTKIKEAISLAIKEDDVDRLYDMLQDLVHGRSFSHEYMDHCAVELCDRANKELTKRIATKTEIADNIDTLLETIIGILATTVKVSDYTIDADPVLVSLAKETRENFNSYAANTVINLFFRCLKEGMYQDNVIVGLQEIIKNDDFKDITAFKKAISIIYVLLEIKGTDLSLSSAHTYKKSICEWLELL